MKNLSDQNDEKAREIKELREENVQFKTDRESLARIVGYKNTQIEKLHRLNSKCSVITRNEIFNVMRKYTYTRNTARAFQQWKLVLYRPKREE